MDGIIPGYFRSKKQLLQKKGMTIPKSAVPFTQEKTIGDARIAAIPDMSGAVVAIS